ncbi:hypothetical protein [Sphingopyxis macrogoltabida]|nr:hypothetical protein [Sphingopyxis macrogoltabida]
MTRFAMCRAAFLAAKAAFHRHRDECRPERADDHEGNRAYEASYQPLVDAWNGAGMAAVRCPVSSAHDLAEKLKIFREEDMFNNEAAAELVGILIADAARIGGAA